MKLFFCSVFDTSWNVQTVVFQILKNVRPTKVAVKAKMAVEGK